MRFLTVLVLLLMSFMGLVPAQAAQTRAGCDSCSIRVDSLDQPTRLAGHWLFTRDDAPGNAAAVVDTSDTSKWRLVNAPGPWKHAYPDGKVFEVGWYRGDFDFAPSLVGQDAVVLVNTYMARVNVYVNGQPVYARPLNRSVERYYSIQPIPVRFRITQPHESIAIRVDTPLMTGIYMLPFELKKFQANDPTLVFYDVWGGELRFITGFVLAFFGLFFLLVYSKTRYGMYLVAALCSMVVMPFFVLPADFVLSLVRPETVTYLHYLGLYGCFFFYLFSQYFDTFTPRINKFAGTVMAVMALAIAANVFHPNVEIFQHVRGLYFVSLLLCGLGATGKLARGVVAGRPGARVLLAGMVCFLAAGINDLLLALGVIESISMIYTGVAASVFAMLYVASTAFANTFVENKHLVTELKGMNENLEALVAERTLALREKTADIQSMLQNMPQGVLTIVAGQRVHAEYSAYLETIFETRDIAGREVMSLLFGRSNLGADTLSSVDVAIASCIGEDAMNYEFNAHLLPGAYEARMDEGRTKALELTWSPILGEAGNVEKLMVCVRDVTELRRLESEASAQKRELEMIGEILSVNQEKFQDFMRSSVAFVEENRSLTREATTPDAELITRLFRNMHTVKGNARTYGLGNLTNVVHEAEQAYDDLRKGETSSWDPDHLLGQLDVVESLLGEYARINDHKLGRKGPGRRGSVERYVMVDKTQMQQTLESLKDLDDADPQRLRAALVEARGRLERIGTEPLGEMLSGVVESLPSLARELGKEPPVVHIADHGIALRNQVGGLLKNLFTHLLRNAIDHGIESPAVRAEAGKPAAGRIDLDLALSPSRLRMVMRDDGQGMALARIRALATERGLVGLGDSLADEDVARLIFLPGFSTAEVVTEVSGRGVGMDAVKGFLEREGGRIDIRFTGPKTVTGHRPFEFVITMPAGFAVGDVTEADAGEARESGERQKALT